MVWKKIRFFFLNIRVLQILPSISLQTVIFTYYFLSLGNQLLYIVNYTKMEICINFFTILYQFKNPIKKSWYKISVSTIHISSPQYVRFQK